MESLHESADCLRYIKERISWTQLLASKMSRIVLLFAFLQLIPVVNAINVNECNDSLITEDPGKFSITKPAGNTQAPIIQTENFWQLTGTVRVVEIEFTEPRYITGLAIRVNTQQDSPCNYIESEINLDEYELIINNKRVNIPRRSRVYKTFVKVAFTPTYGTKVQIRRIFPTSEPPIFCIQYQLYGCSDEPMECNPLISYDYTQPMQPDTSYKGQCYEDWCSGGVGVLTDANYDKGLQFSERAQLSISFYQQVGIAKISLYLIHTDEIATETEYPVSPVQNKTIIININKVIEYIEFNLSSTSSFKVEEILIAYWNQGKDQIEVPCHIVTVPEGLSTQNIIFVVIAVGIFMFIIGIVTPFVIWFLKAKTNFRVKSKERGNAKDNNNNEGRTEHVYTDLHSKDSTAGIKLPTQYSIQDQARLQPQISVPDRIPSPNLTVKLEEQVKNRSLDRRNKEIVKDSQPGIVKSESFMEENSLYQTKSLSNNRELKRFENLERGESEVILSENPHYVSGEEVKLSMNKRIQKVDAVNYENTNLSQDPGEDFDAYSKLNHT